MYPAQTPNLSSPKELIPQLPALEIVTPLLSLGPKNALRGINDSPSRIKTAEFNMTFNREHGEIGFRSAIRIITSQAIEAVRKGVSILIITDRNATIRDLPIPGLL